MAPVADYRTGTTFDLVRVDSAGRNVGRNVYWKLYSIENVMRVIIHSILSIQISPEWWSLGVDQTLQRKAERFRSAYKQSPWHSSPGNHEIYYVGIADLNEIIRANSNLFLPLIPDIDQWMARVEQARLPRNIVAHMNWPSNVDRQRVTVLHSDVRGLANHLAQTIQLLIP